MSSFPDAYSYPDPNAMYHEGDSGLPIRQSGSAEHSWPLTIPAGDQSGYSQSHQYNQYNQSMDPAGTLPGSHDAEDVNYTSHQPHHYDSLPTTSSGQDASGAYATNPNDLNPYLYQYPQPGYGNFQHQSGYAPYHSGYDYSQPPLTSGEYPTSGEFVVYTPQTYQAPPANVYPYIPSTQQHSLGRSGIMYPIDTRVAGPAAESSLDGAMGRSPRLEFPIDGAQHSHPSPVASLATSSSHTPAHSPSRSPDRRRLLPLSADDDPQTGRRVAPRYDGTEPSGSGSGSHNRSRSNSVVPGRGRLIPQEKYTTSSITASEQHPYITFNLENPEQIGIPIIDILNKSDSFARIGDRTQAFSHMGKKTFTLRIQWPGYKSWSKTIAALDWTKDRSPIPRVKLAEAVATAIRDLFEKFHDQPYDADHAQWNVGPNGIRLEEVCLVSLHHVSRGSWQPGLCLIGPRP